MNTAKIYRIGLSIAAFLNIYSHACSPWTPTPPWPPAFFAEDSLICCVDSNAYVYNFRTKTTSVIKISNVDIEVLSKDKVFSTRIYAIDKNSKGLFAIIHITCTALPNGLLKGIFFFDADKAQWKPIVALKDYNIRAIQSFGNHLWLATHKGLIEYDIEKARIINTLSKKTGLPTDFISTIFINSVSGMAYFACYNTEKPCGSVCCGSGIFQLNLKTKHLKKFTLPSLGENHSPIVTTEQIFLNKKTGTVSCIGTTHRGDVILSFDEKKQKFDILDSLYSPPFEIRIRPIFERYNISLKSDTAKAILDIVSRPSSFPGEGSICTELILLFQQQKNYGAIDKMLIQMTPIDLFRLCDALAIVDSTSTMHILSCLEKKGDSQVFSTAAIEATKIGDRIKRLMIARELQKMNLDERTKQIVDQIINNN
jgi:hypothetical protein